jgi:hypothetical protein
MGCVMKNVKAILAAAMFGASSISSAAVPVVVMSDELNRPVERNVFTNNPLPGVSTAGANFNHSFITLASLDEYALSNMHGDKAVSITGKIHSEPFNSPLNFSASSKNDSKTPHLVIGNEFEPDMRKIKQSKRFEGHTVNYQVSDEFSENNANISPVREPETWVMLLMVAGLVAFRLRRRTGVTTFANTISVNPAV